MANRRLPFGDLSKERGKDRLFTIGMCLGLILGMTITSPNMKVLFGSIAVFIIVVRTLAQYRWPDRDVGK